MILTFIFIMFCVCRALRTDISNLFGESTWRIVVDINKLQGLTLVTAILTLCFSGSNLKDQSGINLSHPRRAFRM